MIDTIWHGVRHRHKLLELVIKKEKITDEEVINALHREFPRKAFAVVWNEQQADVLFHRGFEKEAVLKDHFGKGIDGKVWSRF